MGFPNNPRDIFRIFSEEWPLYAEKEGIGDGRYVNWYRMFFETIQEGIDQYQADERERQRKWDDRYYAKTDDDSFIQKEHPIPINPSSEDLPF